MCSQWLARWKSVESPILGVLFCVPEAANFGALPARPWLTTATSLDQRALEKARPLPERWRSLVDSTSVFLPVHLGPDWGGAFAQVLQLPYTVSSGTCCFFCQRPGLLWIPRS